MRMRQRETAQYRYYDDGGPGRGNCTWGIGTLAHRGPCTTEELSMPVSAEKVEITFSQKVAEAERVVRKRVLRQALNQEQFDALVSFTFNAGQRGAESVLAKVDKGDFKGAAVGISRTIYITVRTRKGTKRVVARGLISRRAEESAPFREAKN
ncbi:glycoside hydrolase family protein [Duganella sp. FT80W]|uniref:Lysozyme n=1 Tax=Duganella guangzhouensis TaxID=2666084 RepID=A0A6I2L3L3_9BURK|nr:glycoside hydrolase family protein [Duganella guangzhouensis]MRW91434.1 glycoside hydrolase family protein [Duganella guangzhouensis]